MSACDDIRILLGAHALGSLGPEDEQRVRIHLETCDACSSEAADLAQTAKALALVGAADVIEPVEPTMAPDHLENLLARVRAHRRRRRLAAVLVAACVAIAAGVGGLVAGDDGAPPVDEPPAAASVSAEEAGIGLAVQAWNKGWGTALRAEIFGVPLGLRCSLVAVGQDGTQEIAASWVVPREGYGETGRLTVDGAVGLRSGEVDHYALVTADGETLVTVAANSNPR
ncbi:MAG TPA: zf-HC2 domain-containing protein [Jiangellaceae bacterium]|nr:zf-HC2 domain-containing protein [Jiangellaceae bacterium]